MRKILARYVNGKIFEWYITLSMFGMAIGMSFTPNTTDGAPFQWMRLLMNSRMIIVFLFVVGFMRFVGLCLNGANMGGMRPGPIMRAVGAALSAIVWVQFELALLQLSQHQGFISPGVYFWAWGTVAELYVSYSAIAGKQVWRKYERPD